MPRRPSVAIVGCGRAGGSIGLALQRAGYEIAAVSSHSRRGRERAARLLEVPVLPTAAEAAHAARFVVVAVPDDEIGGVAKEVVSGIRKGTRVVHTSGSVSVAALDPVLEVGGRTGTIHPLQTLPEPERGADSLVGAAVAVTCEQDDRAYLFRIVSAWGGRPFALADDVRELYHAAAVFASNYVATALWIASRLLDDAGVPASAEMLDPLVKATVDNAVAMGAARAITGPVARGDVGAIERHVAVLTEHAPDVVEVYRVLARSTARLAGVDPAAIEEALG